MFWWQLDSAPNADPEMVDLMILKPKVTENYYNTCVSVEQHNWHWKNTLKLEEIRD